MLLTIKSISAPRIAAATGKMKNLRYLHRMLDVVVARDIVRSL